MQLFYQPELSNGAYHLDPDESRHAIKVLRLKYGDNIDLVDGIGTFYQARILEDNFRRCTFEVISSRKESPYQGFRHIAIAPTKNLDRIEWFVEKAVEIGIDRISFIYCKNSERKVLKHERVVKKAISAMKQSIKARLPEIDEMVPLNVFLSTVDAPGRYIGQVDFENSLALKSTLEERNVVLIGPEGDFTPEEVEQALEAGFKKVSLGNSRLRTETAGLVATHILNLFA